MNKRQAFLTASLAALALTCGLFFFRSETPGSMTAATTVAATPVELQPAPDSQAATRAAPLTAAPPAVTPPVADTASNYVPDDDGQITFEADARGHLVMNEKTRLDLERLYALHNPREKKMQEVAATLPPAAARRLYDLMEQYQNYQAAVYQVYPPDREMTAVEQGVSQIDGMHGLRVQYFGEQATQEMFGAEEKAQRELYRLMENEKDPGLTVEEKAERAQRIYREQQGG